ncbi:MAG: DNA replication and repair protein RecF [Oscillospiraceae bacterium]|nr:DNA replication and repair protein RecF [Oscillospiraceae bacterium]
MYITHFSADGFRNLHAVRMQPDPRFNLIIGDNAQGKTNLLDAIWLMTGCRNFHGARERHYLGFDADFFVCDMKFHDDRREQRISYSMQRGLQKNRKISINGVDTSKTGGLFEHFHCVAFSPCDVDLVNGAPEKRRAFMDLCACQLHPVSMTDVNRAALLLAQRNACIQNVLKGRMRREDITMWDNQLAMTAARIACMRASYIRSISPICKALYSVMTGGNEQLSVSLRSAVYGGTELPDRATKELAALYEQRLRAHIDEDLRLGYTKNGIHRDDMILEIDGNAVSLFGSQGQRKSTALVLKLAQAHLYNQKMQRSPVVLLDDVMGELDERRQRLIYDMVSDMQVFITLCHPSSLKLDCRGKIFSMQQGQLTEQV